MFNLSDIKLSEVQQVVLGLGLKFLLHDATNEPVSNMRDKFTKNIRLRLNLYFKNTVILPPRIMIPAVLKNHNHRSG